MADAPDPAGRRGRPRLAAEERRTHGVYVRMTAAEIEVLDERRATVAMRRSQYLRTAALENLPASVPAINRTAHRILAITAKNLNQLAALAHAGGGASELTDSTLTAIEDCRQQLTTLSRALRGGAPPSSRP